MTRRSVRAALRRLVPKPTRRARGLTLLEIMVVITILGIVASVTTVSVLAALRDARVKTTHEAIRAAENALKLFAMKHARYPTTAEGLGVLVRERIVERAPRDGWARELQYTAERGRYVITSYGSDGEPGGEEDATDLTNEPLP